LRKSRIVNGLFHLISGIPLDWFAKYLTKGYMKVDPVVIHCRNSDEVLHWDANESLNAGNKKIRDFMRDAYVYGLISGMAIPLQSPSGLRGVLSLISDRPLNENKELFVKYEKDCRVIGESVHTAFEGLK